MSDLEDVMQRYFLLKDQYKRLNNARKEFMQDYKCENQRSDDPYNEPPMPCTMRNYGGVLVSDACEPCKRRDWYYRERGKNSRHRGQLLRKARILATHPNNKKGT